SLVVYVRSETEGYRKFQSSPALSGFLNGCWREGSPSGSLPRPVVDGAHSTRGPEAPLLCFGLLTLGCGHRGRHFGCEVVLLLLDALAHHEHGERLDRRVGRLQVLLNGLLAVSGLHEDLVEQGDFLQVLLNGAFDHLGSDVSRLAGLGRL